MIFDEATHFILSDTTHIGESRRRAVALAAELGFGETDRGKAAIVVTELTTNALRYAGGGELFLLPYREVDAAGRSGLEILVVDHGQGMSDLSCCMRDGYSSGGTQGTGLGAVSRLAAAFDVSTTVGKGTAVLARMTGGDARPGLRPRTVGVLSVPYPGEQVCGDGWGQRLDGTRLLLMVADGLGHGIQAAEAAREAERIFHKNAASEPVRILQDIHGALRKTRGAAVALCLLDGEVARFVGIGNISCTVVTPDAIAHSMVSLSGTVGYEVRKFQEFTRPCLTDSLCVMHSDGLATQWRLSSYPGLAQRPVTLIAAVLYRDFSRRRDDVTIVVVRAPG